MKPDDFIKTMQLRTAVTAVGPSALRGQGKEAKRGHAVIISRIEFCSHIRLNRRSLAIMLLLSATMLGCSKKEDPPTTEDDITQESSIQATESESSERGTIDLLQGQ